MEQKMTVNGQEFEIIRLLGKGKGGYSYLAAGGTGRYVLKQIHHEPCDYYQFGNKIEAELRDYKSHGDVTELFHLERGEKLRFLEEMPIVAQAVSRAFGAEKMNYELLGMGDAHLHWHLYPRVAGDIGQYGNNGKGPVWWYPMEKMYADEDRPTADELADMKQRLLAELDKLL